MLVEIGCILGGVPLGYALRKKPLAVRTANSALSGTIHVLLFLMGVSLGSNADVLSQIAEIGARGVILGLLCALGSVFTVWLYQRFLLPPGSLP